MASPYNSRRECQGGQANQGLWEYPWTPPNNTSPVFSNPGQSVSPSLRRAMPAQVPSTPLRSIGPILYSPAYGTAPTPWNVNATPVACPNPTISTQHVPWADWGNSSQCNPPPRGVLQPAISFDSVAALSNAGVEDLTPVGGKDGHACDHTSHNEYGCVNLALYSSLSNLVIDRAGLAISSVDGLAARTPEPSLESHVYGGTSDPHMCLQACTNAQSLNATNRSVGWTNFKPMCKKHI